VGAEKKKKNSRRGGRSTVVKGGEQQGEGNAGPRVLDRDRQLRRGLPTLGDGEKKRCIKSGRGEEANFLKVEARKGR